MLPLLTLFLIATNLLSPINTYSSGAPESACKTLLPVHSGGIPAQTSPSPYAIIVNSKPSKQNQIIKVFIESNPTGRPFGGYMIQARNANNPDQIIGKFQSTSYGLAKLTNCDGLETTATHVSPAAKQNIELEWAPPKDFLGSVIFRATVAEEYSKFWAGITSETVQIVGEVQARADSIYDGCGSTKGCFGFPDGCISTQSCRAVTVATVEGEKYFFEMKSSFQNPAYIAVGLSTDDKMGKDSVMECVPEGGVINVYSSYTTSGAGNYGAPRTNVPQNIIRLISGKYENGEIHCKIERNAQSTVQGESFDLINNKYHLLIATGESADANSVGYHTIGKLASGSPRFLSDTSDFSGASALFLRLHGAFMIIAWIGTASLGILLARYFKTTWVGSQMCGKDQWFVWHRTLMICTWLLTMAAFILIFVELKGWSSEQNPHAILGTITTLLCFIQPIGAAFRPHPGHKYRPLFNWGHWLGGNLAHILAIVTIFFAVKLAKAELPEWMDFILVAFVAFHVFMHFVLSIAGCGSDKKRDKRVQSFPMSDMSPNRSSMMSDKKQDAPFSGLRKILLTIYIVIVVLFTAALVVIVVLAPIEDTIKNLKTKMMN